MGEKPGLEIINFLGIVDFVRADSVDHEQTLKKGAEILSARGVNWFVSFGTALGLHRDGVVIPEDSDIDAAVLVDEFLDAEPLIDEFKKKFKYLRSVKLDGKQHQSAFLDDNGFIFDVCFYYPENDIVVSYCDGGRWEDKIDGIEYRATKYGNLPFPKNTEEYLVARYGDWEIKQSKKSIRSCA